MTILSIIIIYAKSLYNCKCARMYERESRHAKSPKMVQKVYITPAPSTLPFFPKHWIFGKDKIGAVYITRSELSRRQYQ